LDLASCEAHLLAERRNPLDGVLDALPAMRCSIGAKRRLLDRAWQETWLDPWVNRVRHAELFAWLKTEPGLLFSARLCLRTDRGSRLDRRQVERLFGRCSPEEAAEYLRRRDQVSGLDLLARVDWRLSSQPKLDWKGRLNHAADQPREWRLLLRNFAQQGLGEKTLLGLGSAPGWTAAQVGRLTLYQLHTYLLSEWECRNSTKDIAVSADEAYVLVERGRAERQCRQEMFEDLLRSINC